jgi:flagellar biosynthesis GTPase FlhF
VGAYIPDALNPLQRTISSSSSASSTSVGSFASAEQFTIAPEGLPIDNSIPTPSTMSQTDLSVAPDDSAHGRKLQEIEDKKKQLQEKLNLAQEKQAKDVLAESDKTTKEIEKAAEKHERERKKQEDKFEKEIRKLEERREKETKKLLLRQQKEADKNQLLKAQRERDEHKQRADISEQENKLLKEQIGELQRENTALVARLGKTDVGKDILRTVREEDMTGRKRTDSSASRRSGRIRGESDVSSVSLARSSTEKMKS